MNVGELVFLSLAIAAMVFGWLGSVVHAWRLGRPVMAVVLFFLHGLWIFWWPLHEKVRGTCTSLTEA